MQYSEIDLKNNPTFVIGDIHGCAKELESMLKILTSRSTINDNFIFVGDYINKGSESKEVIDLLIKFKNERPNSRFLKGNHELVLLDYLRFSDATKDFFLRMGGDKTLESYKARDTSNIEERRAFFPHEHLEFFKSLENYIISNDYVFVHAGLCPLTDLYEQKADKIFWIRDEFINNIHNFNKTVVFGHTPFKEILFHLPYKIGIDTGLAYGNKLSCVEVNSREVIEVKK